MYLYKENGIDIDKNPATKATKDDVNLAPVGFTRILSIEDVSNYCFSLMAGKYKVIRDSIETLVAEKADPPNVEAGFNLCSPSEKTIAATNNIGSGTQIAATLTDLSDRDSVYIDYTSKNKGAPNGVRQTRSVWLESLFWSRLNEHEIEVQPSVFVPVPEYVYAKITINDPSPGEISGNLLSDFEAVGIVGIYSGGNTLGILDYFMSTTGTRFESDGLTTDPNLSALVPSGFINMSEFRDWVSDILIYGLFEPGKKTI
jgi:hypothetical protein